LTFYDRKGRLIGDGAELDDPIEGVIEDDAANATNDAAPTVIIQQPNNPLIVDPNPIIDPIIDPNPDPDPNDVLDEDHSIVDHADNHHPNGILDPNEPPDPDIPIVETVD
jgi:hypothetical protein